MNKFPNGFDNWQETHFLIVETIVNSMHLSGNKAHKVHESSGTGGLFELAKELTNKFELLHKNKYWDGEYFDEIDKFLNKELYENTK